MSTNYYFILMSQKDFLENQVIEEILRERANYYTSKNKLKDFWIINSPKFLNTKIIQEKLIKSNFYKQKSSAINYKLNQSNCEFYTALVTTNAEFIKWIQLRLGYFEDITNLNENINSYVSDGLVGVLNKQSLIVNSFLDSYSEYLHPDILLDRYKKSIEVYYKMSS